MFSLDNYEKIKEERIEMKSKLIKMVACRLSHKIYFVMKQGIVTYSYQSDIKDEKYNQFTWRKETLKCDSDIKAAIINTKETYLAILISPNSLQNAKIEIYNLESAEGQFHSMYKVIENIPASV